MSTIVNESQFLRKGVTYPRGVYSRQIGLEIVCPAGAERFNYTAPLGERVWLLSVDIYTFGVNVGVNVGGFFDIVSCAGVPTSVADVLIYHPSIIEYRGIKPYMYFWGVEKFHLHWDMNRYYNVPGLRFACAVDNTAGANQWCAHVYFQISEG